MRTLVERFDIEPFSDFSAKWANFIWLVLFCIDAKFCKWIFVGKLLTRSTRFIFMRLLEKRTEVENEIMKINHTEKAMHTLLHILNPIEKPWKAHRAGVLRTKHTVPRKRSFQAAAAMPGGAAKRECTRARCSASRSRNYAESKDDACDAKNGARKVQIARCSASKSKNCKISFFYPVS